MSNDKISVLTRITIILNVGSVIFVIFSALYTSMISDGYALYYGWPLSRSFMGKMALICVLGFLFGISGLIAEIIRKNDAGKIICVFCTFFSLVFIGFCLPPIGVAYESTRRMSCASNIKQIHISLKQYAADYSGNFPPANGAAGLEYLRKNDYLTDYAVFTCPSTMTPKGKDSQPLTEENVDYVYIGGLNEKSDPNALILYDKPNNHEFFGNVGAVDGTIKGIYGNPWTEKIKK